MFPKIRKTKMERIVVTSLFLDKKLQIFYHKFYKLIYQFFKKYYKCYKFFYE